MGNFQGNSQENIDEWKQKIYEGQESLKEKDHEILTLKNEIETNLKNSKQIIQYMTDLKSQLEASKQRTSNLTQNSNYLQSELNQINFKYENQSKEMGRMKIKEIQLSGILEESKAKEVELKNKIKIQFEKKIEEDPKTDENSLKIQRSYAKIVEHVLDDIIDSFMDRDQDSENLFEFLIEFLVKKIDEKIQKLPLFENKETNFSVFFNTILKYKEEIVCQLEEAVLKEIVEKFGLEKKKEFSDSILECVDFLVLAKSSKNPIIFVSNKKMNFDTSKLDLKDQKIKIVKVLVPGISINSVVVYKAKVKVELK
jgi:hypothetical protein